MFMPHFRSPEFCTTGWIRQFKGKISKGMQRLELNLLLILIIHATLHYTWATPPAVPATAGSAKPHCHLLGEQITSQRWGVPRIYAMVYPSNGSWNLFSWGSWWHSAIIHWNWGVDHMHNVSITLGIFRDLLWFISHYYVLFSASS